MNKGITKMAVPCSCGCTVALFMHMTSYHNEPEQLYLEFYTQIGSNGWKERLRMFRDVARDLLHARDPYAHEVCCGPDEIVKLRDFFAQVTEAVPHKTPMGYTRQDYKPTEGRKTT